MSQPTNDESVVGLFVVLLFTLPLLIGAAIVAVKLLEVTLDREIASARVVAVKTTLITLAVTGAGVVTWFIYLWVLASGDPS